MKIRQRIYLIYIVALLAGAIGFNEAAEGIKSLPDVWGINIYSICLGGVYFILSMSIIEYFVFYRLKSINKDLDELSKEDFHDNKRLVDLSQDDEIGKIVKNINQALDLVSSQTEDIRHRNDLYSSLVNDSPVLVHRFKPDGSITFVNKSYADIYKKRPEQLIGEDIYEHIKHSGGDVKDIKRKLLTLSPNKPTSSFSYDTPLVVNQAIPKWTVWSVGAIFDECGRVFEYQVVGVNMYHAEIVKESRLSAHSGIVYIINKNGVIRHVSSSVAKDDQAKIVGRNIVDFIHEDDKLGFVDSFNSSLETSKTTSKECRILQSNGEYSWMQIMIDTTDDADGNVEKVALYAADLTEIKGAHAEVVDAVENMNRILDKATPSERDELPVFHFSWELKDK